jgi:hypothetical protein
MVSSRKSISSGSGCQNKLETQGGVYLHYCEYLTVFTSMCLKYIELVNSILFALHIGWTLLLLSGYLTYTQCGYTYSVRLVRLLCRSHVLLGRALLILSGYLISDYTVWIHLLSKAGEATLPIPCVAVVSLWG